MPRIRIIISIHDGTPQKPCLWEILGKHSIHPYKVIESQNTFVIVVDNTDMEKTMNDLVRKELKEKGFDALIPPDFTANKTILVRGLDNYYATFNETDLLNMINNKHPDLKRNKIIKIPTNTRLLKIQFADVKSAEKVLKTAIIIGQ